MASRRRRQTRMVVALSAAVVLGGVLAWTSFTASSQAVTPGALQQGAQAGRSYEVTGKVVPGYTRDGDVLRFRVRDRSGTASIPVRYTGAVPDPFRAGREVVVTVHRTAAGWVGERDSLITKCPSKFSAAPQAS